MSDSIANNVSKTRDAGMIAPKIREQAVREFGFYKSTRKMQAREWSKDKFSRSDLQDLVLLGLMDEIRRLRPLQRRRRMAGRRVRP